MKIKNFFNNLNCFFNNEEEPTAEITGTIHKNDQGKIMEIRFYNPDYDEFMVIERNGNIQFINVLEFEDATLTNKKK